MTANLFPIPSRQLARSGLDRLPAVVARAGEKAAWRFLEFFTANIRNKTPARLTRRPTASFSIGVMTAASSVEQLRAGHRRLIY